MKEYINGLFKENKKQEILFTFSHNGKSYAVIRTSSGTKYCVLIKYALFKGGIFSDGRNGIEAAEDEYELAYSLYDMLESNNIRLSGMHIDVKDTDSGFDYSIKTRSRYFNIFYKALPVVLYLAVALITMFGILYTFYSKNTMDWAVLINEKIGTKQAVALMIAAAFGMFELFMYINREKSHSFFDMLMHAYCSIAAVIISFGILSHVSVLIAVLAAAGLLVYYMVINRGALRSDVRKRKKQFIEKTCSGIRTGLIVLGLFSFCVACCHHSYRNMHVSDSKAEKTTAAFEEMLENFDETEFDNADTKTKRDFLQSVVDHEALVNGTFSAKIIVTEIDNGSLFLSTNADYDNGLNIIRVNKSYLDSNEITDVLHTVLHEYAHVMQHYLSLYDASGEKGAIYKDNYRNYISGLLDYDGYLEQPLEADARSYSTERVLSYYSNYFNYRESSFYDDYILGETENVTRTATENDEFEYTVCHKKDRPDDDISGDFIILTSYTGEEADLDIPSEIDGITVSRIAPDFIDLFDNIPENSINIPATVTDIGYGAFKYCDGTTITVDGDNSDFYMQDGVLLVRKADGWILWSDSKASGEINISADCGGIAWNAFCYSSGITGINVEEGNKKYKSINGILYNLDNAALLCPAGKEGTVKLADGTTAIKRGAFRDCDKITEVIIPDSCAAIYGNAFKNCGITELTVPDSVKTIASDAFECMRSLTTLTIPATSEIEYSSSSFLRGDELSFMFCNNLTDVYYGGSTEQWAGLEVYFDIPDDESTVTVHCNNENI